MSSFKFYDELMEFMKEKGYGFTDCNTMLHHGNFMDIELKDVYKILPKKSTLLKTMEMLANAGYTRVAIVGGGETVISNLLKRLHEWKLEFKYVAVTRSIEFGSVPTKFIFFHKESNFRGDSFDAAITPKNYDSMYASSLKLALRKGDNPIKVEIDF